MSVNINKYWVIDWKAKRPSGQQPEIFNKLLDAKWQLKIEIGTDIFKPEPLPCGVCKQKEKVNLRWYMLVNGDVESSETYCYKCGQSVLKDFENTDKLSEIEILTPNYKEIIKEIKEQFEKLNTEWTDKEII